MGNGPRKGNTLLLHVGIPKTGSSALQTAFTRNRDVLARHKVRYAIGSRDAEAARGDVTTGNALTLLRYLCREQVEARHVNKLTTLVSEVSAPEFETTFYSSEVLFSRFHRDRLRELREHLDRAGVRLHVAIYVRNIAGHACSAYSQAVKSTGYTGSFSQYITHGKGRHYTPRLNKLQTLHKIVGGENLSVFHYDSVRQEIFPDFLRRTLNISDLADFDLSRQLVNRSLTPHETEMMRYVGQRLRDQHVRSVSRALIAQPPFGDRGIRITSSDLAVLHERFSAQVDWINDQCFGQRTLRIESNDVTVTDDATAPESLSAAERHLLDVLAAVADGLPVAAPTAATRNVGARPKPERVIAGAARAFGPRARRILGRARDRARRRTSC